MDSLDDYLEGVILSDKAILERVDEYALYTYYLGGEPELGPKFPSPIRPKNDPDTASSFSLFPTSSKLANNEYVWKDHGTGQTGNVFKLIGLMHGIRDLTTVYRVIDRDLQLGFSSNTPINHRILPVHKPVYRGTCDIKIRSKPFTTKDLGYWQQFGITEKTLLFYNVSSVELFWLYKDQKHPKVPSDPCYAYRVWSKYKLYRPLARNKEDKFRNDYTERHLEGFCQLKFKSDTLIITKSNKENMMFHEFGYESVASHSENNILPVNALKMFESKYKNIVVWYDNDGKHLADKYPYDKVFVPLESGEKDPTDYRKRYGEEAMYKLIKQLIK
jgi:hypothetical protein